MFRRSGRPVQTFATLMASDIIRFLYEPARCFEVLKSLMQVSPVDTLRFGCMLAYSTSLNPEYLHKFRLKSQHAKEWAAKK
jgi:hypothetical protein